MKSAEEIIKIVEDEIKHYDELSSASFKMMDVSSKDDESFWAKAFGEEMMCMMVLKKVLRKIKEMEV